MVLKSIDADKEIDRLRSEANLLLVKPNLKESCGFVVDFYNVQCLHSRIENIRFDSELTSGDIILGAETNLSTHDRKENFEINISESKFFDYRLDHDPAKLGRGLIVY